MNRLTKEEAEKLEKVEKQKDFEELAKVAEKFINKWGNPHSTIIIEQGSIEFCQGEMAMPLEIPD